MSPKARTCLASSIELGLPGFFLGSRSVSHVFVFIDLWDPPLLAEFSTRAMAKPRRGLTKKTEESYLPADSSPRFYSSTLVKGYRRRKVQAIEAFSDMVYCGAIRTL
jgi:hypothetical protein